ncbi:MAG TPA: NAD(P)/FAD-dependent oxidoreductase [Pyrinomonadaceae bacterium]|nr:NAD(P)/FAD-dependent oxidoreductase [Pyrinomonadaceae bacterium]
MDRRKILIVGAGVAGSSLAIRLARSSQNFDVVLAEKDKFPRHKLCGEFISPEALMHFQKLDVLDEMFSIGGDHISETVFYSASGRSVSVPSGWFENGSLGALGISRAEMDLKLLNKAKDSGANVLEETGFTKLLFHGVDGSKVRGARLRDKDGKEFDVEADLVIDATGRARVLARQIRRKLHSPKPKTKFVAFKTHLRNARVARGVCEIYLFQGGYGGLSWVEDGVTNCCFIIRADVVRAHGNDPARVWREVFLKNPRAFEAMKTAEPEFDWIAVSIDVFGEKDLTPAPGLISVGDAAAFIDPFTGSGMLMALESSELLAECVTECRTADTFSFPQISKNYGAAYHRKFGRRLALCKLMRPASFSPALAESVIFILRWNKTLRHFLTKNTRPVHP